MLPKPLFVAARNRVQQIAKSYIGETNGKTGLAAVPAEIGRRIEQALRFIAGNQRIRVSDEQVKEFLLDMAKAKIIVPHPWGGWMAPTTEEQPAIPPKEAAKTLVKELYKLA